MNEEPTDGVQAEPPASDATQEKPGSLWIIWAFLTLLIYVLSIGPVAKFIPGNSRCAPALKALYYPVLITADKCAPFARFLYFYLNGVWRVRTVAAPGDE